MIGLCESNGRGQQITRPLERRLEILGQICARYTRIADVGAGQGRLSRRLMRDGATVYATERTPRGVAELRRYLEHTMVTVLHGDGLVPLTNIPPVNAIVLAGMGSVVIQHVLEQRQQLNYRPRFAIQVVQGRMAVHRYLRNAQAHIEAARLIQERNRIYATWVVMFPDDKELTTDWNGLGLLQEFCDDPLWPELCDHEAGVRRTRLTRSLPTAERRRIEGELQYWQSQLSPAPVDR